LLGTNLMQSLMLDTEDSVVSGVS